MRGHLQILLRRENSLSALLVCSIIIFATLFRIPAGAAAVPEPVVAIHVSELTRMLDGRPGVWWSSWHYFVIPESLEEALRSDGTPFIEVTDADIASGRLLYPDGSPRYPIVISLASEAVADSEISPLRDYVSRGGFLFVGSSAFTRNRDGTNRGDFALADEMGLHMVKTDSLQNWYRNLHFSKNMDNRLVAGIPSGRIAWRMPLNDEEVPLGISPGHTIHGYHYVFQVNAAGASVIANGDSGPLLAVRQYGNGNFIYHGAGQPLIGHTIYDPAMYAYLIYRNAIEWAFESAGIPVIKLSPWPYEYDAAFVIRHDCENNAASIRSIESSAQFESTLGVKGQYYFCTGTLREEMPDRDIVIASLRRAVSDYGAVIGSHNGGLKNPVNTSLSIGDFDYWHWGPDEVLNMVPPGYSSGQAYAQASISRSYQDIEGWLAGLDNGRTGCGRAGNCPRTWAAPYFNSTREQSNEILENLDAVATLSEQKIGPFPHWTLSYQTPGRRFSNVSIPASAWYVGSEVPGALEWGHTIDSMHAAVDFYYNLGAMIELYSHEPSNNNTLIGQYVQYCLTKPRMWATTPVGIYEWWQLRTNTIMTPVYSTSGDTIIAEAVITGSADPGTAVEIALPGNQEIFSMMVMIDGAPAGPADYRITGNTLKIRAGLSGRVEVQYRINSPDNNPVPAITGLSPATATAGGADFTLTIDGSGFMNGSVVQWNGTSRTTTYISPTRLTAEIPAADIDSAGTVSVIVYNPAPGGGSSNIISFTITGSSDGSGTWTQTDWSGGDGQFVWADAARYGSAGGIDDGVSGQISLASANSLLFSDDFTRSPDNSDPLSPWIPALGSWSVSDGVMRGSGAARQYSYSYFPAAWTDYTVQGRIQIPAGSFGGGIGGRVDPATGAHYGAWVYPSGSAEGSNVLKLWKFRAWTDIGSGTPMGQVSLPVVGTGWHTVQMTFIGNRILVYYDGDLKIDMTDNNYDSHPAYMSGGISADWWTGSLPYTLTVDDISVMTLSTYGNSGILTSSAFDGGEGVQWQTVSWDSTAGAGTDVCVRTRTADSADQLINASWSDCYSGSGSSLLSANRRWIQYRLELTTGDPTVSPYFDEIRISYETGTAGDTVPVISSLSPSSATAGNADFTLTVNGSGFVSGSVVRWNGMDRTTTYVSSAQLTAAIPATDMTVAGTASVTVFNPALGGGTSNIVIFTINTTNTVLFSDDFTRSPDNSDPLSPWIPALGTWSVSDGVMRGSGAARQYSYAYFPSSWADYTVQGRIQIPAGSFGGGIGGRVDPATGAHYGAWVYPSGSSGVSNVLKLWKFRTWMNINSTSVPMGQGSLPVVGTGWHTIRMTFEGSRILVYYDGELKIDVTDNNYDSRPPYLSGGISADWWTGSLPYTLTLDDISVMSQ